MRLVEKLKKAEKEGQAARDAEEKRRLDEAEKAYQKNLQFWSDELDKELAGLPDILDGIARSGQKHEWTIQWRRKEERDFQMYKSKISDFAKKSGLQLDIKSHWISARSGDPESGEGACDAHTLYIFTLTW